VKRFVVALALCVMLAVICSPVVSATTCIKTCYCFYCTECGLGGGGDKLLVFDTVTQTGYWTCDYYWACNGSGPTFPFLCSGSSCGYKACALLGGMTSPAL